MIDQLLSACCYVPMITIAGNESTSWYICDSCKEPCDPAVNLLSKISTKISSDQMNQVLEDIGVHQSIGTDIDSGTKHVKDTLTTCKDLPCLSKEYEEKSLNEYLEGMLYRVQKEKGLSIGYVDLIYRTILDKLRKSHMEEITRAIEEERERIRDWISNSDSKILKEGEKTITLSQFIDEIMDLLTTPKKER